jgi:hypothetical protein
MKTYHRWTLQVFVYFPLPRIFHNNPPDERTPRISNLKFAKDVSRGPDPAEGSTRRASEKACCPAGSYPLPAC